MKVYKVVKEKGNIIPKGEISIAKTKRAFDIIEADPNFKKSVIQLRKDFSIPINGFPKSKKMSKKESEIYNSVDFQGEVYEFIARLKLPPYWHSPISMYLLRDSLLTPIKEPLAIGYSKDSFSINLLIRERLTKVEMHRAIDNLWEQLEIKMRDLPYTKTHKMIRVNIAKKIAKLRDVNKMSFPEISEKLQKEYIDSELYDLLNTEYVKMLYSRWKRKISNS